MSEQPEDVEPSDNASGTHTKPRDADEEPTLIGPFRILKSLVRRKQRWAAKQYQYYRYTKSPDVMFAKLLGGLNTFWHRANTQGSNTWIAWFTFVLMIASIFQGGVMIWSNWQTQEIIGQMRVEQRAWLAASAGPISPFEDLANPEMTVGEFEEWFGKWVIKIRNVGKTPALNIRWETDWHPIYDYASGNVYAFDYPYTRQQLTKAAIERGAIWERFDISLNPGDLMDFPINAQSGTSRSRYFPLVSPDERVFKFYGSRITGAFVYDDVWGNEHSLFCCFRHEPDTGRLVLEQSSVDYTGKNHPPVPPPSADPVGSLIKTSAKELLQKRDWPITDPFEGLPK